MAKRSKLRRSWSLFNTEPNNMVNFNLLGGGGSTSPRHKVSNFSYKSSSLSTVVFNRIATDAAMISINHVKVNPLDDTTDIEKGNLQHCFNVEANIDQNGFQFFHDLFYSCMEEGVVAVVPTEANWTPNDKGSYEIYSMRVGKIIEWFPKYVRVRLYNEETGEEEDFTLSKRQVAIIENPFYEIVNSNTNTLKRLNRKMQALDSFDEDLMSNKFNLIFQLPYEIKGATRQTRAKERVKELQDQLKDNNQYGVAYTGNTEKVIQLNRPIDNDLAGQVKYLRDEFFNQLGLTDTIFNGTASESEMNNYFARTLDPLLTTVVLEFKRKFLTKTAMSQGHDITYNRDIFKLVPASTLAEIADKMSRNEILTPNELRTIMGFRASKDPKANELLNRNISVRNQGYDPYNTELEEETEL